jgi:Uma2 family endonuclease
MMQQHTILTEERHREPRIVRSGATIEEYMEFENTTEERHEFHNGDIITMPGVYHKHDIIVANLVGTLFPQLR